MAKAMSMKAFEKSPKDVEPKGMKEGSKADRALDKKQMKAPTAKAAKSMAMKAMPKKK